MLQLITSPIIRISYMRNSTKCLYLYYQGIYYYHLPTTYHYHYNGFVGFPCSDLKMDGVFGIYAKFWFRVGRVQLEWRRNFFFEIFSRMMKGGPYDIIDHDIIRHIIQRSSRWDECSKSQKVTVRSDG